MNYQNNSNSIGVKKCVQCYNYLSIHTTICKKSVSSTLYNTFWGSFLLMKIILTIELSKLYNEKMLFLFRASDAKELILALDIPDYLQQVEIVSNILRPEMIRRQ